jgi:hypothetical protein
MEDLTNKITDLIIKSDEPLKTLKDDNSSLVSFCLFCLLLAMLVNLYIIHFKMRLLRHQSPNIKITQARIIKMTIKFNIASNKQNK